MFKSWKTTLAGFAAGVLYLLSTGVHWKSALVSTGLGLIGALAKDHDVATPHPSLLTGPRK